MEKNLLLRSEIATILQSFCEQLERDGYLDSDWRHEPPSPIDHFLSTMPDKAQEKSIAQQLKDIWSQPAKPVEFWGCYMEGTDEKGISDDILLSVHSTAAGAHENSMRMQKEYGGKHYTDKVVIHA